MTRAAFLLGLFLGALVGAVVIANSLYRRQDEPRNRWIEPDPEYSWTGV